MSDSPTPMLLTAGSSAASPSSALALDLVSSLLALLFLLLRIRPVLHHLGILHWHAHAAHLISFSGGVGSVWPLVRSHCFWKLQDVWKLSSFSPIFLYLWDRCFMQRQWIANIFFRFSFDEILFHQPISPAMSLAPVKLYGLPSDLHLRAAAIQPDEATDQVSALCCGVPAGLLFPYFYRVAVHSFMRNNARLTWMPMLISAATFCAWSLN